MNDKSAHAPFRGLGNRLKSLREKAMETLADTSGAVEIDVKQLASYELGQARPAEDVLMLLLSHFDVQDDESVGIWELAGYGIQKPLGIIGISEEMLSDFTFPLPGATPRIIFTDTVDVIVNNYGVVMNFMQGSGSTGQPASIAKVGMSREHAKSVLQILQATLAQTEKPAQPRRLPTPDKATPDETANK